MSVNADKLVQIVPRVIDAGTSGLTFSGLFLTQSELPPTNRVLQFSSAQAVADYFGSASDEARAAQIYFQGYTNTQYLPGFLLFAPYRETAAPAWLRGAAYQGTLADLKLVRDGGLSVDIDGVTRTANGVDFYTATSFSDCAQRLQTALSQTAEIEATAGTLTGGPVADVTPLKGVSAGRLDIRVDMTEKNLTGLDFASVNGLDDVARVLQTALTPASIPATAGTLTGGVISADYSAFQSVSAGKLNISIDGSQKKLTDLNFSSVDSLAAVAQVIETALSGAATVTVEDGNRLVITSATTGATSSVSPASNPEGGSQPEPQPTTDLAGSLGLTDATGATAAPGTAQVQPAGVTVTVSGSSLVLTSPAKGARSSISYASDPDPSGEVADLAEALGLTQAAGAISVSGTDAWQPKAPIVSYSSQTQAFQIASGETGEVSSVGFARGLGGGTDLSGLLNLTEQLGAVQSEGTSGGSLTECMSNILKFARDWVSFSTLWEPLYAEKIELARWCSGHDTRFVYVMWDTDNAARVQGSTASAGYAITQTFALDGTCCVWNSLAVAAGVMGAIACLNFDQREGRTTLAFRQFEGVPVTCDDDEDYEALLANGYNCYADFATASAQFKFFQNGQVSGKFDWLDTYCNAIALKDALQLNILDLFSAVRSLPYNEDGYSSVRTACLDTINRFVNFGAIRVGISLSQTQKVQLLQEIGKDVSQTLESAGWYMQVADPGAVIRGQRQSPNCAFYYMDGGSIQKIVMSATAIQ